MTFTKSILLLSCLSILAVYSCKKGDGKLVKTTSYSGTFTKQHSWRQPQPNGTVDSGILDSSYLKTIIVTVVDDTINIEGNKFRETSSGNYVWQWSVHSRTYYYVYPDSLRTVYEASTSNGSTGQAAGYVRDLDVFIGKAQ